MRKLFLLILVFCANQLLAQTTKVAGIQTTQVTQPGSTLPDEGVIISNPVPASPDAAALGKYGNIPVSPYTGVPNISIPLYTVKSGNLSLPISLSYHSSGNKVEEMASSVGLGWVLNAGGVITRSVRGKYDEELNGFLTQPSAGQINSMINNAASLPVSQQQVLDYYLNATADGTLDSEPDIYNFNFGGYSGQFFMNSQGQITVMPLQNISFQFTIFSGEITYIQSFTAKTPDGNTYYFGTDNAIEFTHSGGGVYHSMSWYLYKITSPSFHEIDFTYSPELYSFPTASQQTFYQFVNTSNPGNPSTPPADNQSQGGLNYFSSVKLSKITFENGSLQIYSANPRYDINNFGYAYGAKIVDTIAINSGNFSKLYKFYYLNTTTSRLRLDSLVGQLEPISGTNNFKKEKYSFTYNPDPWNVRTGDFSFLFSQDYWGFYNGHINALNGMSILVPAASLGDGTAAMQLPGANRAPDESSMLGGMLTRITYPTGGYTNFSYEANTESNKDVGGTSNGFPTTHFNTTLASDPQYSFYTSTQNNQYVYNGPNNYSFHVKLPMQINGLPQTNVKVNFTAYGLKTANPPASPPAPVDQITATFYGLDSLGNQIYPYSITNPSGTIYVPPGLYWLDLIDHNGQGDSSVYANYIKYAVTVSWDTYTPAQIQYLQNNHIVGGLRIHQIADYDGVSSKPVNLKAYQYYLPGTNTSSGWLGSMPVYSYVLNLARQVMGDAGAPVAWWTDSYFVRSSTSSYPLITTQGSTVGYSHVEELLGANGENGKNEYYYTNTKSDPDYVNQGGAGFPFAPPESYEWHRGLLLKETTWKNAGNGSYAKVNEKANSYTTIQFNVNNFGIKAGLNPKPTLYNAYSSYFANPNPGELGRIQESTYFINTDYNYLSSDTSRTYDQSDQSKYVQTINNYQIDPATYQVTQIQSTNSKNEKIIKKVTYPNQYNAFASGGINGLLINGITTYPIEEVTQKSNLDGSNLRTIKAVYSTYKTSGPFRDSVYEMRSVAGVPNFTMSTAGPKDSHYQPVVSFDKYDTYGNILQERKVGDALHSYIWGYTNPNPPYNNTYPIAEVINADSASTAYTNFESYKTNGLGNWVYNSGGLASDATAPMGFGCYTVSGTNTLTKNGLNTAAAYVVSFWSKSGAAISVTGGTVTNVATGNAKSGWVYHEYSVTGTTSVTIGGTGSVDEVRLYPSTAQMSTYTYIPLVGIASKCDARNNIVYYVYDNVGRLIHVLDQNNNIVKDYNYHYQGQ